MNFDFNLKQSGCGAKNLALLQNQCKPSRFGKLINQVSGKMVHNGKNYSLKLHKNYFCNGTGKEV